ncbi:hypothetical protein T440DRAFT_521535 [Plenodomus tracheiphilus IPT5]|uniref:Uncharacterized protein n=1 Tax=Plenodomus tracheiphilus IPT5 TaxID=1408161 RepID=A0A6A7AUK9_9PLEO|nr:hypothetical protein T440DRAFT_521535 [Plenodomus tracheiphilus IPT5]
MCRTCQSYTIEEAEDKLQRLNDQLSKVPNACQAAFRNIRLSEDSYREGGVQYHKTNLSTRQAHYLDADRLQGLKQHFESPDYQLIFAKLHSFIPRLHDLASAGTSCQHSRNCLNARRSYFRKHIAIIFNIEKEMATEVDKFINLCEAAEELYQIQDKAVHDVSWFEPFLKQKNVIPSTAEWTPFVTWLAGLPEVQNALPQRSMLSIASNMLGHDSRVYLGPSNVPLPLEGSILPE